MEISKFKILSPPPSYIRVSGGQKHLRRLKTSNLHDRLSGIIVFYIEEIFVPAIAKAKSPSESF